MADHDLSAYETQALHDIEKFKNPEQGRWKKAMAAFTAPVDSLTEAAFDTKVGAQVTRAINGVVDVVNDGASWTVRTEAILEDYRNAGYVGVRDLDAIRELDLASVDRTVGNLAAKYKALGAAAGGIAGVGGAAGLAMDIPALIGLALRACNEYAAYHGFDPTIPAEQAFIMHLMAAASATSPTARAKAVSELTQLAVEIGERESWDDLDDLFTVDVIRRIAEMLGVRIAKGKVAQMVPVFGTVVGAGYNAWYLGQVTDCAAAMYRERFLIELHGPDIATAVH